MMRARRATVWVCVALGCGARARDPIDLDSGPHRDGGSGGTAAPGPVATATAMATATPMAAAMPTLHRAATSLGLGSTKALLTLVRTRGALT